MASSRTSEEPAPPADAEGADRADEVLRKVPPYVNPGIALWRSASQQADVVSEGNGFPDAVIGRPWDAVELCEWPRPVLPRSPRPGRPSRTLGDRRRPSGCL